MMKPLKRAEPDRIAFIQEFTTRRFPLSTTTTPTPTPQQQSRKEKKQMPPQHSQQQQPAQQFPALPQATLDRETEWPANISVHIKKNYDGDYTRGGSRKSVKKLQPSSEASMSTPSSSTVTATEKKKKNKKNEMSLEAALKELDIKSMETSGKRRVCNCQATKHPLLTVAPNCLNCGKIICTAEGPGPCTFCGTPVLSKDQQIALIEEAKRKRAEQKQQQRTGGGRANNSKVIGTPSIGYAAKVSGEIIPRNAYQEPIFDQKAEEDNRRRAEEHKEKLLEFQRSSAKRTTVIGKGIK
ncbi:putative zinc finger motif, C2HC5-type-domain-containing protein [Dichotomocladium elegans]|nr:putative zinc finger motif, C2HC5-type-domain-containing protein [Dichotomocladium elegans]